MTDPFSDYIASSVNQVVDSPSYAGLDKGEKAKISKNLEEHFGNLIIETFINRLDDAQVKELGEHASKQKFLEEKFTEYAALIPDLATDIEDRLGREVEALKLLA